MSEPRIFEGLPIQGGYQVEFKFKRTPARIRIWSEPTDVWGGATLTNIKAPTVWFPFTYDVRKTNTRFYAEVLD